MRAKPVGWTIYKKLDPNVGDGQVMNLRWSPDGRKLASSDDSGVIRLWDDTGGSVILRNGRRATIYALAWSADGSFLASGGDGEVIEVYDAVTGTLKLKLSASNVMALAWSPKGAVLASGSEKGPVTLWDCARNPPTHRRIAHPVGAVYGISWSADASTVCINGYGRDIALINVATGAPQLLPGMDGSSVFSAGWSSEGDYLAAGFWDGTVRLWKTSEGPPYASYDLLGHASSVESIGFSMDGTLLASRASDDTVRVWHTKTRQSISVVGATTTDEWVGEIAFHPQECQLAIPSQDDTKIFIWAYDLKTILGDSHEPSAQIVAASDFSHVTLVDDVVDGSMTEITGASPTSKATAKSAAIFISYARADVNWLEDFRPFITQLEDEGLVDEWDDTKLPLGAEWLAAIEAAIAKARIVLLMVSQRFLASRFIREKEIPLILAKARANGATVIPVLLTPSLFLRTASISVFNAFPPSLEDIASLTPHKQQSAWRDLAEKICDILGHA